MKTCIRRFCNEGHDILTAGDMRKALSERPVKGTSACVCEVDESKRTLEVNKIDGFSKLHNIQFGEKSIRAWRSYGIGRGKEISYHQLVSNDQGDTALVVSKEFFPFHNARVYEYTVPGAEGSNEDDDLDDSKMDMFEYSEPGCVKSFQTFSELDLHLNVGDHCVKDERLSETVYDKLRRDWAERFTTSVSITDELQYETSTHQVVRDSMPPVNTVSMGWALPKPRAGSTRFSCKVKNYLTANFDQGEQSGLEADPQQVSNDMPKGRQETSKIIGCLTETSGLPRAKCRGFSLALQQTEKGNEHPQKSSKIRRNCP